MDTLPTVEKKERIKIFDSVRAIATIAVFLFHAGYLLSFNSVIGKQLFPLVYFGGTVGVSIFFVLSGFLLFYQLYKDDKPLDKQGLKEYVKKRLLRILPLYYFSIFFIVLILHPEIWSAHNGFHTIINNLLFIRDFHNDGAPKITLNPVFWTLIIEMHFYILLPIFYYIFYKFKKIYLFFAVIFLGLVYRIFLVSVLHTPSMQLLRLTPSNFDFFAFGMLGAYLYIKKASWLQYLGRTYMQVVLVSIFLLFVRFYDLDFHPTIAYVFAPVLLGCIVMMNILGFVTNEKTSLGKIITSRPILFIAQISFGIYIWHPLIFEKVDHILVSNSAKLILDIVFTIIAATITYYTIESPLLKLKSKAKLKQKLL